MAIFYILFKATSNVAEQVTRSLSMNTEALYSLLAVLIFLALALTVLKQTRRYAWTMFAIAIAIVATLLIKRPIWKWVSKKGEGLPLAVRICLRVI